MTSGIKDELSDKLLFTIGEVSRMCEVEPHVLRYWEREFGLVKPRKDSRGRRRYTRRDVEIIAQIKKLLYNELYTLEGAKKKLREWTKIAPGGERDYSKLLKEIKGELLSIKEILDSHKF